MTALAMQLELKRLALKHGMMPEPYIIPLTDPVDHDVIIEGFAATSDIDQARMKFRPWCFNFLPWQKLPARMRSRSTITARPTPSSRTRPILAS